MNKKLTINDIANLAGVGKSTVSRYFNGGYVKDETKEKIAEVVKQYNYQPNKVAQNLKSKYSNIIGLVVPTISSRTMARTVEELEKELKQKGYTTIIINTSHDESSEVDAINNLYHMQVDGIILFATHFSKQHDQLIQSLPIPIICVGQANANGISIVNGDYDAGVDIGKLIGERGYRKVVYLGVDESDIAVGRWRKQGVFDGLHKYDIDSIVYRQSDFTFEKTQAVVKDIIENETLDIIVCATDNMALAAYKELMQANIKIPQEIAVIGFGGYEISQLMHPSLQTVRFNNEVMGRMAAKTILDLINNITVQKLSFVDYKLVEGQSI